MAKSALKAASDVDKVRANGVRALGNLAKFVIFLPEKGVQRGIFLEKMVKTLLISVSTGNAKVQWNVCYAASNLFQNPTTALSSRPWTHSLLLTLSSLLIGRSNFKIRIHAAASLSTPPSRSDFGESFSIVVLRLAEGLEKLEREEGEGLRDFKYKAGLFCQLTSTFLHLVAMAEEGRDREAMGDPRVEKTLSLLKSKNDDSHECPLE